MSVNKKYTTTGKYRVSSIGAALTELASLANLSDWKEISLTTPTANAFQLTISRVFPDIVSARAWITALTAETGFESVTVVQS